MTALMKRKTKGLIGELIRLTLAGGLAFWVTTAATSLLPIASDYRAAFSDWSIQTVWVASFFAGHLIACCVGWTLLRHSRKTPVKGPILKSLALSTGFLFLATILIDVPKCFQGYSDSLFYLFIGFMFNLARFFFLGIAIGFQHKRLSMKVIA